MLVFDFFAGTRSSTQAFEDAGHTVISFELDEQFDVTGRAGAVHRSMVPYDLGLEILRSIDG